MIIIVDERDINPNLVENLCSACIHAQSGHKNAMKISGGHEVNIQSFINMDYQVALLRKLYTSLNSSISKTSKHTFIKYFS